jgi:hypothetical protein
MTTKDTTDSEFIPHEGSPAVTEALADVNKRWAEDPLEMLQLLRKNFPKEKPSTEELIESLSVARPAFPTVWRDAQLAEWTKLKELLLSPEPALRRDGRRALPLSAREHNNPGELGALLLECLKTRVDTDPEAYELYMTARNQMPPGHILEYAKEALTLFPQGSNNISFAYDVALFEEGVDWLLEEVLKGLDSTDAMVNALARAATTGGPWFWPRYEAFKNVCARLGVRAAILKRAMR